MRDTQSYRPRLSRPTDDAAADRIPWQSASTVGALASGDMLGGRWVVRRPISLLGIGEIYLVADPSRSRLGVVKVPGPRNGEQPALWRSSEREGEFLEQLSCPNIVSLIQRGWRDDGTPFIVTELLEGIDVASVIARRRLTRAEVLQLLCDVSYALEHAHERGVVHRDVSPRNLFWQRDPCRVVLLDFRAAYGHSSQPDDACCTMGTLPYLAPERLLGTGEPSDPRCDVHGLAAVVQEALTGAFMVEVDGLRRVPWAHELRPEIPRSVSRVLASATSPDPDERPATPREFLERVLRAW